MPWRNNRIPTKPRLSVVSKFHWGYRDLACKLAYFALRLMIPFLGLMLLRQLWRWNWQRVGAKTQIVVPTDNLDNTFFRFLQREKKFVWSVYWYSLRNSRHFTTRPQVFPPNVVWAPFGEIPYWLRVTTQIWVVLLIGRVTREIRSITQIWVVNVNGMKFLQWLLRRHFPERPVVASSWYFRLVYR